MRGSALSLLRENPSLGLPAMLSAVVGEGMLMTGDIVVIYLKHFETKPHADSSHERIRTLSGTSLHAVTLAQWLKRPSKVDQVLQLRIDVSHPSSKIQ